MAQDSSDRLVGTTIDGRYQIESRIARGGMAKVYLATDLRLERKVAVKVMHDHLVDDADYAAKFIREARHTARLAHPNIVSVFDQGHEGDLLFLVMEYLPGITLRELLNDYGSLTVEQALDITTAVLQALVVAHREGILHRDVKPENVMLVNDGRIKIGDFGLARPVTSATETGKSLLGTVAYIAPELLTRGQADNRSDLYSVGVMLYEMLAGKQPFTGDTPMQIAMQHAKKQMPLASLANPFVGQAVDDVIQWATSKNPQDRPKDARAFLDALRAASVRRVSDPSLAPAGAIEDDDADLDFDDDNDATSVIEAALTEPDLDDATTPLDTIVADLGAREPRAPREPKVKRSLPSLPSLSNFSLPTIQLPKLNLPKWKSKVVDPDAPVREKKSRKRLALILALALVVLGAGGTGGYWWYNNVGPGSMTHVVDVIGMPAAKATSELKAAFFIVQSPATKEYNDQAAKGTVIGLDPDISGDVKKKTKVRLIISLGPVPVKLASFAGATAEDFAASLAADKIGVTETFEEFNDTVPAGQIISIVDAAGTALTEGFVLHHGDKVTITTSLGPVPVVTGKSAADATAALQGVGLTVVIANAREFSDSIPNGAVIRSTGPAGVVHKGDSFTLVLSKGPDLVAIPNVVGASWTIAKAKATLEAAGFKVSVVTRYATDAWNKPYANIERMSPVAGSMVRRGTTVSIYTDY